MIQTWKLIVLATSSYAFTLLTTDPDPGLQESMERGKELYNTMCVTCHMADGTGVAGVFPPLAQADYLENTEASIHAIKYGLQGEITVNSETYNNIMTPLGLDDQEVADVMNYILNSWGNEAEEMITEDQVAEVEEK
jgi:mono/diheme cytochrome c family protein